MELLKLVLTSVGSVIVLFLLSKLMGNKQMSELSMFDYIIGISIGSIAAEMATELEEFYKPLIAMVIYALLAVLFSHASIKFMPFRRFGFGKTLMLYKDGMFYRANMKKAQLDISEILVRCRAQGFFDISQLSVILFEPNGKLSFLPHAAYRPATPSDLSVVPQEESMQFNAIMDGKIMHSNLEAAGHNENWLKNELKLQGIVDAGEIFLATCDRKKLTVYRCDDKKRTDDPFQ